MENNVNPTPVRDWEKDSLRLDELKQEDGKGTNFKIPNSIKTRMVAYQKAYKFHHGKSINREDLILQMMMWAEETLKSERMRLLQAE